jgi:hypothetical protein
MSSILCDSAVHHTGELKCRHDDKASVKDEKMPLGLRESPLPIRSELADNDDGKLVAAAFPPAAVRSRRSGVVQSVFQ